MRIILNADDFGYSDDTVDATIECFESGALTSASIMPQMPASARAITYAKGHPQFSFGLHLTFSSDGFETCISPPIDIPALAHSSGQFKSSNRLRVLALLGWIPAAQLELEMRQQLWFLYHQGLDLSHVDSHGHLHKFPLLCDALGRALVPFRTRRVRNIQNVYLGDHSIFTVNCWLGPAWRRRLASRFTTTNYFYTPTSTSDRDWPADILQRFQQMRSSETTLEIGVHPGLVEEWRAGEKEAVKAFAKAAVQAGHDLADWRSI